MKESLDNITLKTHKEDTPMNMKKIVATLREQRTETQDELDRIDRALSSLTHSGRSYGHKVSAEGRRNIAKAQRKRWARVKKAKLLQMPTRKLKKAA